MKAMIFCAGLGTRFKPWTLAHPKALALVNGKSLLQRNIEYLQRFGIKDVILNVHHFADQVREAVRSSKGWGSRVAFSDETDALLDTGGGLLKAKELFTPGERFITCNVDILTEMDIRKLLSFHEQHRALIAFGVTDRVSSRYLLLDAGNRLSGWRNTKTGEEKIVRPGGHLRQKAYSCVVVFEYGVFRLMEQAGFQGKFSLIDAYLRLAPDQMILGYDHSGDRLVDVGRPEMVPVAESLFE